MKNSTIKPKEFKTCQDENCQNEFKPFLSTQKYCSSECAYKNKKERKTTPRPKIARIKRTKIKPVSDKQKKELAKYHKDRLIFLAKPENKICPVKIPGLESQKRDTTEIHHMKGRTRFADDWARLKGIKLLHDQRYWLPVSRIGHRYVEENPEWAKDQGYSFDRL